MLLDFLEATIQKLAMHRCFSSSIFLNRYHSLMYSLNLAFGFIFFHLFLGLWIKDKTAKNFFAKIVSALFYILSIYLINTFYTNQITAIYLVSAIPATLYFFLRTVLEKRTIYAVISALYISVFSVKLESIPWSFALLICLSPLFLTVFWGNKKI